MVPRYRAAGAAISDVISEMGLSSRQCQAIAFVKTHGRISNKDYRELTGVNIRTATRDLENLVGKELLRKIGTTGRSIYYIMARKQDIKRTNRT